MLALCSMLSHTHYDAGVIAACLMTATTLSISSTLRVDGRTPLQLLLWQRVLGSMVFWRHWWQVEPRTLSYTLSVDLQQAGGETAATLVCSFDHGMLDYLNNCS